MLKCFLILEPSVALHFAKKNAKYPESDSSASKDKALPVQQFRFCETVQDILRRQNACIFQGRVNGVSTFRYDH